MNFLWSIIIIISFMYAIFNNKIVEINNSIFSSASNVINMMLVLSANTCLWCGVINIVQNTSIIKKLNKILKPVIYFLFPEIKNENKIVNLISMNMISNICGIGNAATPAGLKAMEKMQEINRNKKELSNSMMMLIVLNTTSIQIIPTTVLAIRSALESSNPSNIIIPIWISTIVGTTVGIISMKILIKYNYKISDKK